MTALSRETFTAEFLYEHGRLHAINGYTSGETWNGWQCPYFTLGGMRQLVELLKRLHDGDQGIVLIDEEKAGIFRLREASDEFNNNEHDSIRPKLHNTIDGIRLLYYMGGSWIWDLSVQ